MERKGIDANHVLLNTGIDVKRLLDPTYLIDTSQCRHVIGNMIQLCDDPGIGFEIGEAAEPPDLGIIGYAIMSCRSMRQTLILWGQYSQSLVGIMSRLAVEESEHGLTICVVEPGPLDAIYMFCVEEILVMMYKIGSILAGGEPVVEYLTFNYTAPTHASRYHQYFQCPIHFEAPRTSATLAKQWLDAPLRTNDEEFNQICIQHCGQILQQIEHSGPLAAQLRSLFLKNPSALPKLDEAANALNISARSLRRHLMEESTSFQKLADAFRADLACEYLRSTRMAPKEIAHLLGFKDPSMFRRAFKLWTGKTISEYRASPGEALI
jgi:AraC-like DNA-binding protein